LEPAGDGTEARDEVLTELIANSPLLKCYRWSSTSYIYLLAKVSKGVIHVDVVAEI
jgi:hypothetical protein